MARLHLFVEGQTEQTFADTVLKPHLANFGVFMHNPALIAHAYKKGKFHKGGGRNFLAMQKDIHTRLKEDSGSDVFFTTMIDLYDLPSNFPTNEEAEKLSHLPYKRVEVLEMSWFDETGDNRFIPFIQLHEFEAYLFSDVSRFDFFFDNADTEISALRKMADKVSSPELIDDGQHTAPSKRIGGQFPEYEDSKPSIGSQMAERIGLENIRSKCPHFNGWLKRLEKLGTEPPRGNDE